MSRRHLRPQDPVQLLTEDDARSMSNAHLLAMYASVAARHEDAIAKIPASGKRPEWTLELAGLCAARAILAQEIATRAVRAVVGPVSPVSAVAA